MRSMDLCALFHILHLFVFRFCFISSFKLMTYVFFCGREKFLELFWIRVLEHFGGNPQLGNSPKIGRFLSLKLGSLNRRTVARRG